MMGGLTAPLQSLLLWRYNMPIQLSEPIYEDFILEDTDKRYKNDGDPTTVTIKKAAQHEHERRQDFFKRMERKFTPSDDADDMEVTLIQDLSQEALKKLEVQITMVGCNILDEKGKPLFKFTTRNGHPEMAMHPVKFAEAWGKLPPDVANEIHDKVVEVNFQWGPEGE
jgi:hypothetical protein